MPNDVEKISLKGLDAVRLRDNSGAACEVYVYGAHVASWKSADGVENLYASSTADIGGGKALRGGIPICWPQFAAKGQYAKHGFCRTSSEWKIVRTSTEPYPCVVLGLSSSEATRAAWPFDFDLRYSITLDGPMSLSTSITVSNPSTASPIEFSGALHTYFACAASGEVRVHGLEGVAYENSAAGGVMETQPADEMLAFRGETDRIYHATPAELTLMHVGKPDRHLRLLKMGFPDAVCWNIGGEKAPSLKDMAAGEWERYVCVEAAIVNKPVKLPPQGSYYAGQTFTAAAAPPPAAQKKAPAAVGIQ